MYSKRYYARKKFFSSLSNLIWSVIMLIGTLLLIGVCVYGCNRYWAVMGPELK